MTVTAVLNSNKKLRKEKTKRLQSSLLQRLRERDRLDIDTDS